MEHFHHVFFTIIQSFFERMLFTLNFCILDISDTPPDLHNSSPWNERASNHCTSTMKLISGTSMAHSERQFCTKSISAVSYQSCFHLLNLLLVLFIWHTTDSTDAGLVVCSAVLHEDIRSYFKRLQNTQSFYRYVATTLLSLCKTYIFSSGIPNPGYGSPVIQQYMNKLAKIAGSSLWYSCLWCWNGPRIMLSENIL